jgi:hypothetical protein
MKVNENLIRSSFDASLKYKPSLQKFVYIDDDDDEIDYRVLGDILIKNMPWPIGVELRRLFSGSMRKLDRHRLDQIFKTIERIMQFTSFVLLSQTWIDKTEGVVNFNGNFKKEFEKRFSVLSMGNYSWLIRVLVKTYRESSIDWFIDEVNSNFDAKFLNLLDFWVPERNEIGHYQINLTEEEIEKRCVEYEEKLTEILIAISFYVKYRLVSIRDIHVDKNRMNSEASFHHVSDLLNSSDSDFKSKELISDTYTDSRSVLLLKNLKSINEYLNLSPLIIDTNSEIIDHKDKFDIKKDIFMYTKFKNDHLMYIGTEVTEKCDLRTLSNYDDLLEEYKSLVETLTKN